MHTEEALRLICSIPVQCTEIFFNCEYEISPGYINELKSIADGSGVSITSLHPYTSGMEPILFFSGYDRRFEQGRDMYKRYYQACAQAGAKYIVFHGGSASADPDACRYFERYNILLEDAKAWGVELCHENVSRCAGKHLSFFAAMKKLLPDAGYVFDVKQAIRSGHDPTEMAELLGANIRHIHISDHDESRDCLPPGQGVFNIGKFLSTISQNGYSGALVVELYQENFSSIVEITQGYQLLSRGISTAT